MNDGATGLHEINTNDSLASQMGDDMITIIEQSKIDNFEAFLHELAVILQCKYDYKGEKSMIPSASLAAIHLKYNKAYFYQLGDFSISY